jgi:hypothetical protein
VLSALTAPSELHLTHRFRLNYYLYNSGNLSAYPYSRAPSPHKSPINMTGSIVTYRVAHDKMVYVTPPTDHTVSTRIIHAYA